VLPCSYRGYGKSQGQPNEAGIKLDAQAALDHLLKRKDVNNDLVSNSQQSSLHPATVLAHVMHVPLPHFFAPCGMRARIRTHAAPISRDCESNVHVQIVVLGKSLGGAVALHLAASNPDTFKAIVIENTFLSIEDVAPKVGSYDSSLGVASVLGHCTLFGRDKSTLPLFFGGCWKCTSLIWQML
jgi:fermentation-respiration switch protein FrsA (DUF1100 family)